MMNSHLSPQIQIKEFEGSLGKATQLKSYCLNDTQKNYLALVTYLSEKET